jgi:hypothetical protein
MQRALDLAFPFLIDLAQHTRSDLTRPTPFLEELLARGAAAAANPGYPLAVRGMFRGLTALAQGAREVPFSILHHGDMNVADLLVRAPEFRVLDWEWAERRGLPFIDFVSLGLTAASLGGPAAAAAAAHAMADAPDRPPGPFAAASELARSYCRRLGLADSLRAPLAAASLLAIFVRLPDCRVSEQGLSLLWETEPLLAAARTLADGYQ